MDAIMERSESFNLPMLLFSLSWGLTVEVQAKTVPAQNVPNVAKNSHKIRSEFIIS